MNRFSLVRLVVLNVFTSIGLNLSHFVLAQELPCGQRRLFKDGSELTTTYDAAYHYVEGGSVTFKDGFVGKPGFTLKPSLNCNQSRPPLEELIRRHAPQIRHFSNEDFNISSVEWFLDNAKIVAPIGLGYTELETNIEPSSFFEHNSEDYHLTAKNIFVRNGNRASAKTYIHVLRAHNQNFPYLEDDLEIQYWFFYPYNGNQGAGHFPPYGLATEIFQSIKLEHEGDWEYVRVILDSQGNLKKVFASQHDGGAVYSPNDLAKVPGTDHIILYSASESHALYNDTGWQHKIYDQTNNGGFWLNCWEEGRYEIVEVGNNYKNHVWKGLGNSVSLINHGVVPTEPTWLRFIGRWGVEGNGVITPKSYVEKWRGENAFFGFDYTVQGGFEGDAIKGSHTLCYGPSYDYKLEISNPYSIEWMTANYFGTNHFSNKSGTAPVLTTQSTSSSYKGGSVVGADVTVHYAGGYDIFYDDLRKKVWFNAPNVNAFDMHFSKEIECRSTAVIVNDGYYTPSSVDWAIAGNASFASRSITHADLNGMYPGGGYTVFATTNNSCGSFQKDISSIMECFENPHGSRTREEQTSSEVEHPNTFTIYPNPTTGLVKIRWGLSEEEFDINDVHTRVFNYSGQLVKSFRIEQMDESTFDLDLSDQEMGLYLVQVFQGDVKVLESKLLKQ